MWCHEREYVLGSRDGKLVGVRETRPFLTMSSNICKLQALKTCICPWLVERLHLIPSELRNHQLPLYFSLAQSLVQSLSLVPGHTSNASSKSSIVLSDALVRTGGPTSPKGSELPVRSSELTYPPISNSL